ncbi:Hypothetical protein, putative [Bodo saltans]|uniref:GPI-anchored surface protein n=1 Tax=Bodo saltans TaxID=75058 RepID=A0A0S4ISK1_BODSA|nr:Hypothetical protein, putative [Bodo saltans]|eukprot:CUF60957.1 Hypothetical protein, putative [Bodo saltans]
MLRVLGFIILLQISCYSPLTFADGVNPNVVAVGSAFERELQTFTSITANKQSKSAERTLLSARLQFQKLLKEDPTDFRSYLAMGTFLMTLSVPEGAARQHWEDVTSMLGAAAARIPTTAPSHLQDLLNNGLRKSRLALLREERRVVQELVNRCDDSTKTMKDVMNVTSELLHATTKFNAVDESSGVASSDKS